MILTVRDNTVDVTLAAGSRAREALRDGSPQLRALLELTGATTGHVVIRELSSGAGSLPTATNAATSGGQQHPPGNGSGHATHQGASDDSASAGGGGLAGQPGGHRDDSAGGPGRGQAGAWGDGNRSGPDRSSRTGPLGVPGGSAGPHVRHGTPASPPVGASSPTRLDLDL